MPTRIKFRDAVTREISLVDRPAQTPARVAILKRADDPPKPTRKAKRKRGEPKDPETKKREAPFDKNVDLLTSESDSHQHGVTISAYEGKVNIWLDYQMRPDDERSHSHPVALDEDGNYVIGTVLGHSHTVDQSRIDDLIDDIGKNDGGQPANKGGTMPEPKDDNQVTELTKKVDDLTEKLTKAEETAKRLERAESVIRLSAVDRAHFDNLSTSDQDAFLAKSAADRAGEIEAAKKRADEENPVLYKRADGTEIRKSDGQLTADMAKQLDEETAKRQELEKRAASDQLRKRAETELSHLPGTVDVRAEMLRKVEEIEDEEVKKAALSALHSNNEDMKLAYEKSGARGAATPTSNEEKWNDLVKKAREEDPKLTEAQAFDKVAQTPEGSRLYDLVHAEAN